MSITLAAYLRHPNQQMVVLTAESIHAQRARRGITVNFQTTIIAVTGQRLLQPERIGNRRRRIREKYYSNAGQMLAVLIGFRPDHALTASYFQLISDRFNKPVE